MVPEAPHGCLLRITFLRLKKKWCNVMWHECALRGSQQPRRLCTVEKGQLAPSRPDPEWAMGKGKGDQC